MERAIANLTGNHELSYLLKKHNRVITNVSWDDTNRDYMSSGGKNISDSSFESSGIRMPIIRHDNFEDITHDIPTNKIHVNSTTTLEELLKNAVKTFELNENESEIYSPERDDVALVSASCVILPNQSGMTEFVPKIYNYQSRSDDPAVLTILVTADGISPQITYGTTPIYFHRDGTNYSFIAERLQDVRGEGDKVSSHTDMNTEEKMKNMMMIIQIPLKQITERNIAYFSLDNKIKKKGAVTRGMGGPRVSRGMDMANISLGTSHGPVKSIKGKTMKRDHTAPVRVNVLTYRVTDGEVEFIDEIINQLDSFTKNSVDSGSLVTEKNSHRATASTTTPVKKVEPFEMM